MNAESGTGASSRRAASPTMRGRRELKGAALAVTAVVVAMAVAVAVLQLAEALALRIHLKFYRMAGTECDGLPENG